MHSDNGAEFLNHHLLRFSRGRGLTVTQSRPYKKNDNPHAEPKNRQFVREVVGYPRHDTPVLDPYANLLLPARKLVAKTRNGSRVHKRYNLARSPFQRRCDADALDPAKRADLEQVRDSLKPMAIHRRLEQLISCPPQQPPSLAAGDG